MNPVNIKTDSPFFAAPDDPGQWPAFRSALHAWRHSERRLRNDDGTAYDDPRFAWASRVFACGYLMLWDQTICDPLAGRLDISRFLEDGRSFGGYDAVVLWQAYPRIGFDDRNQFDFFRQMPGGLAGVRSVVDQLHRAGVRAFIAYKPWDTGTRREQVADVDALAEMVRELDADGVFLDTMSHADDTFRRTLDEVRPGVVMESEHALAIDGIATHHLSWAQWFVDSHVPGVLRNKWYERRHLQHQVSRWSRDHSSEIHTAWMNGSGVMVWENVFGSMVPWCERDKSWLRTILPIQRRYADVFTGEGWTPLVETGSANVFASRWDGDGATVWTLVNRADQPAGASPTLPEVFARFDLVRGERYDGHTLIIPPRGLGALLTIREDLVDDDLHAFLASQREVHAGFNADASPPQLPVTMHEPAPTKIVEVPDGMVSVHPPAQVTQVRRFLVRECGMYGSYDHIDQNMLHQPCELTRHESMRPFAIDRYPVTNRQFFDFLRTSNYQPPHRDRFLAHWRDGEPPDDRMDHPVVYVDLDDARAYARWAGKRLPTEAEWQYAAEGERPTPYPWGDELHSDRCNTATDGRTTPVHAHPASASPCGCQDMIGNVWQWTESERSDGRNRFCILKGGGCYRAEGSIWYTEGGPLPSRASVKFLRIWPGLDRCATIGLRCVADLAMDGR